MQGGTIENVPSEKHLYRFWWCLLTWVFPGKVSRNFAGSRHDSITFQLPYTYNIFTSCSNHSACHSIWVSTDIHGKKLYMFCYPPQTTYWDLLPLIYNDIHTWQVYVIVWSIKFFSALISCFNWSQNVCRTCHYSRGVNQLFSAILLSCLMNYIVPGRTSELWQDNLQESQRNPLNHRNPLSSYAPGTKLRLALPDAPMATFMWQPDILHLVIMLIIHVEKALDHF